MFEEKKGCWLLYVGYLVIVEVFDYVRDFMKEGRGKRLFKKRKSIEMDDDDNSEEEDDEDSVDEDSDEDEDVEKLLFVNMMI